MNGIRVMAEVVGWSRDVSKLLDDPVEVGQFVRDLRHASEGSLAFRIRELCLEVLAHEESQAKDQLDNAQDRMRGIVSAMKKVKD